MRHWALLLLLFAASAQAELPVYDDAIQGGWRDWSWGPVERDFVATEPVHSGSSAIAVTFTGGWSGLKLSGFSAVDVTGNDALRFWVHGGQAGGQNVQILLGDSSAGTQASVTFSPAADVWTRVDVPLFELGAPPLVRYIQWFNPTSGSQPTFYIDDVEFVSAALPTPTPTIAPDTVTVYHDTLENDWRDWSWGGITRELGESTTVEAGSAAVAVTYTAGWSGFKLGRLSPLDLGGVDFFRFYLHGGASGGQTVRLLLGNSGSGTQVVLDLNPVAGQWKRIDVSLAELGWPVDVDYIQWFNATASSQPTFYLDEMAFYASGLPTPTPPPPAPGPALSIDVAADRHEISPYIYGMNFAPEGLAAELRLPVRRWGGNATSRYNWQNDTTNRGVDWYFENIPNDNQDPSLLPSGSSSDRFIEQDRRTGTATFLAIPMIGWAAKSRARACGFSVARYGAQQSTDPWSPDCGNGIAASGEKLNGNDPADTSVVAPPEFVGAWIAHLKDRFGSASAGGVRLYNLDNEPDLWHETHRDVHPAPAGYDEIIDRTVTYATAIKDTDPGALIAGPASWGWTGYFWSALDWSAGGSWWNRPADRLEHGDVPFLQWYLQQMAALERQSGRRLLDYLDVHYYPQASGVALSGAGSSAKQALRLRSTRSLWDPDYVDESWIGQPVRLIPRLRDWVDTSYPGTGIAIGEYNWGALGHINGALAQADVLGIFGRERLNLATLWEPPAATDPGAFAFRMFRNYDGQGGQFGDIGVYAASSDQSQISVYAAQSSSSGVLTILVVNKDTRPFETDVELAGFSPASTASLYRYSGADLTSVVAEEPQTVTASGFAAALPGSSISLFVLRPASGDPVPTPASCGNGLLENGEQCDDGNLAAGDGCDSTCRRELIPGSPSATRKGKLGECLVEWSVVNPGNSPALSRRGLQNPVQACRDDDPACDFELDRSARTCEFEVAICLNNIDPALPWCSAPGIDSLPRVLRPTIVGDPVNASAIATALERLRDSNSGFIGVQPPLSATQIGICSEPFRIRVPRPTSERAPGRRKVATAASALGGTPRDEDKLTFLCLP